MGSSSSHFSSFHSVTQWIAELKAGDQDAAAQKLWQRYYKRLVTLARRKLRNTPRRVADEDDVVSIAFHSFCQAAREGRFPQLNDRHDLWQILLMLTARKAADLIKHERRQKRGGGKVRGESVFRRAEDRDRPAGIDDIVGEEPTPEEVELLVEQFQQRLDQLGSESLRTVALLKLEGYTAQEIAEKLDCVVRTVERKLSHIRSLWSQESGHE